MKLFKDYITERKQVGTLYHYSSFIGGLAIIKENWLAPGGNTFMPLESDSISFTRNKNFHITNKDDFHDINLVIRFKINGDKLTDKYKVKPYSDTSWVQNPKEKESEEVVKGSIKPFLKYVTNIDININRYRFYVGRHMAQYAGEYSDRVKKRHKVEIKEHAKDFQKELKNIVPSHIKVGLI